MAASFGAESMSQWVGIGQRHERAGEREEARQAYRSAIQSTPTSEAGYKALTNLELAAGNSLAALRVADQMAAVASLHTEGLLLRAQVLSESKRWSEAAEAWQQVHAARPSAFSVLAWYRARREAALPTPEAVLVDWVAGHPTDYPVRMTLGDHYLQAGQGAKAAVHYEALRVQQPSDSIVLNNLAWWYGETGDARAVPTARSAAQLAPDNPLVLDTLGWLLFSTEPNSGEALRLLEQAAKGAPESAEIGIHLASAYQRQGRAEDARSVVDRLSRQGVRTDSMPADLRELVGTPR